MEEKIKKAKERLDFCKMRYLTDGSNFAEYWKVNIEMAENELDELLTKV